MPADLWTFNSEAVARAVAGCRFPVVTGIGHEIDTSVCDYVSDMSAATPTAAAEVVSPDAGEVRRMVDGMLGQDLLACLGGCETEAGPGGVHVAFIGFSSDRTRS